MQLQKKKKKKKKNKDSSKWILKIQGNGEGEGLNPCSDGCMEGGRRCIVDMYRLLNKCTVCVTWSLCKYMCTIHATCLRASMNVKECVHQIFNHLHCFSVIKTYFILGVKPGAQAASEENLPQASRSVTITVDLPDMTNAVVIYFRQLVCYKNFWEHCLILLECIHLRM